VPTQACKNGSYNKFIFYIVGFDGNPFMPVRKGKKKKKKKERKKRCPKPTCCLRGYLMYHCSPITYILYSQKQIFLLSLTCLPDIIGKTLHQHFLAGKGLLDRLHVRWSFCNQFNEIDSVMNLRTGRSAAITSSLSSQGPYV